MNMYPIQSKSLVDIISKSNIKQQKTAPSDNYDYIKPQLNEINKDIVSLKKDNKNLITLNNVAIGATILSIATTALVLLNLGNTNKLLARNSNKISQKVIQKLDDMTAKLGLDELGQYTWLENGKKISKPKTLVSITQEVKSGIGRIEELTGNFIYDFKTRFTDKFNRMYTHIVNILGSDNLFKKITNQADILDSEIKQSYTSIGDDVLSELDSILCSEKASEVIEQLTK